VTSCSATGQWIEDKVTNLTQTLIKLIKLCLEYNRTLLARLHPSNVSNVSTHGMTGPRTNGYHVLQKFFSTESNRDPVAEDDSQETRLNTAPIVYDQPVIPLTKPHLM
jgi:hypothetical protein